MYSINSCNDSLRVLKLFRDTILKKVTTRGRDHMCLLPSAFLRHHSRDIIEEIYKARTLQQAQKVDWTARQRFEDFWVYSFFLPKQASIVWSVHSAFQHSEGSGGVSPIVREKPSWILKVGFGSSGLSKQAHAHKTLHTEWSFRTGPRSTNPSTPSAKLVAEP